MYEYQDIRAVHLEVTTKCNAACPQCGRNWKGGILKPHIPMVELRLQDVRTILPPHFVRQIGHLYMCGNFGDAIVAQDTLEIFRYLRSNNLNLWLQLHTNGSARKVEWWEGLADVIGGKGDVFFGIDGLEDTNHIYRRRTSWNIIMRNASAFIKRGGVACWNFIVFRHNEHQVAAAEELATQMGFSKFVAKKTGRFYDYTDHVPTDHFPVRNEAGDELYRLEPPVNPDYQNASLLNVPQLIAHFGSLEQYFRETPISCRYSKEKKIYVTAEGHIFPCCWTHGYHHQKTQMQDLVESIGGLDSISAFKHPIKDIVQRLHQLMPDHWDVDDDRLTVCGRRCGIAFDQCFDGWKPDGFRRDGIGG